MRFGLLIAEGYSQHLSGIPQGLYKSAPPIALHQARSQRTSVPVFRFAAKTVQLKQADNVLRVAQQKQRIPGISQEKVDIRGRVFPQPGTALSAPRKVKALSGRMLRKRHQLLGVLHTRALHNIVFPGIICDFRRLIFHDDFPFDPIPGALRHVLLLPLRLYDVNKVYGDILENTSSGIFGNYTEKIPDNKLYKVVGYEDIKLGKAKILTVISNDDIEEFDINIIRVSDKNDNTKNILFEVTDKRLLDVAGGIVQGMSGSPIVQDENIIGAVTHVVVDDPTKGYGILITTMLEEAEN